MFLNFDPSTILIFLLGDTFTMTNTFFPFSIELSAIWPNNFASSFFLVQNKISFIILSTFPCHFTLTMHLIIFPLALIYFFIRENLSALTFNHSFLELSLIIGLIIEENFSFPMLFPVLEFSKY